MRTGALEQGFDAVWSSPLGRIGLRLQGECLAAVAIVADNAALRAPATALAKEAQRQFEAYFRAPTFRFDLPLLPQGTLFQQRLWHELQGIASGDVATYGELAVRLHSGARAIGGACRRNPWLIVVPCHRVVAAGGHGGYAGQSAGDWLALKQRLLRHEGASWPRRHLPA